MSEYIYKNWKELEKDFKEFKEYFFRIWNKNQLDAKIAELKDLEQIINRPDFWDDPENAKKITLKKSSIEKNLKPWLELKSLIEDFPTLIELVQEESKEEALSIISKEFHELKNKLEEIQISLSLLGEDDNKNAILTIVSGAGGTESMDWADMLLRMYTRWAQKKGYEVEILDYQPGEEAGIKSATLLIRGENAFGYLKCENGIHRLVRQSPFNANNKRHTSFASVHVSPEIDDDVQIDLNENDLRIDTYRASGAGGQHVNKTDSAVRILHIPTGIVVQCQNERSQHKNKATALKMLKSKLYELEKQKRQQEIESKSGEKKEVSWGNQIRSYVFHPYKLVKDLRTDYETSDIESVMDGEIDEFIKTYLKESSTLKI